MKYIIHLCSQKQDTTILIIYIVIFPEGLVYFFSGYFNSFYCIKEIIKTLHTRRHCILIKLFNWFRSRKSKSDIQTNIIISTRVSNVI